MPKIRLKFNNNELVRVSPGVEMHIATISDCWVSAREREWLRNSIVAMPKQADEIIRLKERVAFLEAELYAKTGDHSLAVVAEQNPT